MERFIAWPLSWSLYWLGHWTSLVVHALDGDYDEGQNKTRYALLGAFSVCYQALMRWSLGIQEWGNDSGPWERDSSKPHGAEGEK